MEKIFFNDLYLCFSKLIKRYGFKKGDEFNGQDDYSITYCSDTFCVQIEQYRRDLSLIVFHPRYPHRGIALFNLLDYLKHEMGKRLELNSFDYSHDSIDNKDELKKYYKKQINYMGNLLYKNFDYINGFFKIENLEDHFQNIRDFVIKNNPNLFKK